MDTEKDILAMHVDSTEDLLAFLIKKAENHNRYSIYSNARYFQAWLKDDGLFLSDGEKWNDKDDHITFQNSSEVKRFGLCFTYMYSENVAMWMLYGGMKHDGVLIPIRKGEVSDILKTEKVELGYRDNGGKFISQKVLSKERGDFEMGLIDMLYYGSTESDDYYTIKRSDARVERVRKKIIDMIPFAKKAYPWSYENECRLYVSVPLSHIDGNHVSTVKIPMKGNWTRIAERVVSAPNHDKKGTYLTSKLMGKIDWDLCKNCDK